MKKIIVIVLIALLGLSIFMVGRKIWEYNIVKEQKMYFYKSEELDQELEKLNESIEKIKEDKKEEIEKVEEWKRNLEEIKENL